MPQQTSAASLSPPQQQQHTLSNSLHAELNSPSMQSFAICTCLGVVSLGLGVALAVISHRDDDIDGSPSLTYTFASALITLATAPLLFLINRFWLDRSTIWKELLVGVALIGCILLHLAALILSSLQLHRTNHNDLSSSLYPLLLTLLVWNALQVLLLTSLGGLVAVLIALGSAKMFKRPMPEQVKQHQPFHIDLLTIQVDAPVATSDSSTKRQMHLAMSELPGRIQGKFVRVTNDDLQRASSVYGVRALVSLNRDIELQFMDYSLSELDHIGVTHGITSFQFVVRDKFIPDQFEEYAKFVCRITKWALESVTSVAKNSEGKSDEESPAADPSAPPPPCMLIHCKGGKGRTGLTAVCMQLLLTGLAGRTPSVRDAISLTRQARPGTIRNPLQQMFAHEFKWRLPQVITLYREV